MPAANVAIRRTRSRPVHKIKVCLFPFPDVAALAHRPVGAQTAGQRDISRAELRSVL